MVSLTKFICLSLDQTRPSEIADSMDKIAPDQASNADTADTDDTTETTIKTDTSNSEISSIVLEVPRSPASSSPTGRPSGSASGHLNEAYNPDEKVLKSENNSDYSSNEERSESSVSHFTIKWSNLDYTLESKWYKLSGARKPILNSLDGCFKSGELSAVLGPSGAGKSTLVDCLVGKRRDGLSGKTEVIFQDGKKRDLKIVIIPQSDHLMDSLTVTEALMFASKLKNSHIKNFDHFKNVQRVLDQLDLTVCSKQACSKLSGGQYKRVSIGQELLSNPDIMILDEPTSGLDAVTCFNTVSALRDLIRSSPHPMAVIATIHQPDSEVFSLFQHVYVLASGGRTVYEGSVGDIGPKLMRASRIIESHHESVSKLRSNGNGGKKMMMQLPSSHNELDMLRQQLDVRQYNPAKLIVEVAAHSYGYELVSTMNSLQRQQHNEGKNGNYKTNLLAKTSLIADGKAAIDGPLADNSLNDSDGTNQRDLLSERYLEQPHYDYDSYNPKRRANLEKRLCLDYANSQKDASFIKHVFYHCHRTWLTILRDPMLCTLQIFLHVSVPLLISYAFYGYQAEGCPKVGPLDLVEVAYSDRDMVADLHMELRTTLENLGYMFFQIYVIVFAAVCVTSLTFPLNVHVLLKEYRNGWYNLSSYFIGRTLADLPMPTFNGFLAMFISYHLTGQAESPYHWRFFSVAGVVVLATLIAQTQGLMFGAFLMNAVQSAVFVAPASTAPLVVVSGFLLRTSSLPWILQVFSKLSYFTYVLNGFIVSRYGFDRCPCELDDFKLREDHDLPSSSRSVINIWLDTFRQDYGANNDTTSVETGNVTASMDLVEKMTKSLEQARSFGFNITSCEQMKPYPMMDYELKDYDLTICFVALIIMLVVFRVLAFISLTWMIRTSV